MISVIIPAYNEEKKGIGGTICGIHSLREVGEIVAVNDGSADSTWQLLRKLQSRCKKLKAVDIPVNRGKGNAMRAGAAKAKGDVIVFIDASQFDFRDIPRLAKALKGYDMAIGVRDFGRIPLPRRINNYLSKLAVFLGTGRWVSDTITGFRAMRRKDFLALGTRESRYSIEAEINFKALLRGYALKEVPVDVDYGGKYETSLPTWYNLKRGFHESLFTLLGVFRCWLRLW